MTLAIKTPRLILRKIAVEDAARINMLCNDHDVASQTLRINYPCSTKETLDFIGSCNKSEDKQNHSVVLTIILQATNEIIGVIGLDVETEHERGSLGYWLGKNYWGKGYATEAANALMEHGFKQLKLNRIYGCCWSDNKASSKVLQKIGMQYEGCSKQHIKKEGILKDVEHYAILNKHFYM